MKKIVTPINDNSCIYGKVSEFLYKPIDFVEGLAIRNFNFREIMNE